jgi:Flp pilus assembly protein TadD
MLYLPHDPHDDDILWMAKAHVYRKLGKKEQAQICIDKVLDAFGNPKVLEYNLGR